VDVTALDEYFAPLFRVEKKSKMWPIFTDKLISDKNGSESFQPYQLSIHGKLRLSK
jgi:hypothetical protein